MGEDEEVPADFLTGSLATEPLVAAGFIPTAVPPTGGCQPISGGYGPATAAAARRPLAMQSGMPMPW